MITNTLPQAQYEFEIDASVVYQLGEMLISDEVQALIELVKNSYDADASYANIIVQTKETVKDQSRMFPDTFLFSVSLEETAQAPTSPELISDLNAGQVPEPLRQGFERNKISLDSAEVVTQKARGGESVSAVKNILLSTKIMR